MNLDLFACDVSPSHEIICRDAYFLRQFALPFESELLGAIEKIIAAAPLQKMVTPGGLHMSVATTSCGAAGWVSDAYGYRYAKRNRHLPWPAMPEIFFSLAQSAANQCGFKRFSPDSCLINAYCAGAKMSLHQDKNEKDFSQPIVSVSLGLPAIFLLGGKLRSDKTQKIALSHGDVVVWGGSARLNFHGVLPVKPGVHPLLGEQRINLTFRRAL